MKTINALLFLLVIITSTVFGSSISSGGGGTLGLTCTDGQVPEWSTGGFNSCLTASGSGTVTSVAGATDASSSGLISFSGTVTAAGNITESFLTQSANCVLAGPSSGSAAAPTCRAMVANDLPAFLKTNALTNSTALIADGSGNVASSSTTSTELGYVHNVTSAIQTQLNGKLASAGTGLVEEFAGHIIAPANYTYVIDDSAAYAYTINSLEARTSAGTITCKLQIGGVDVTSSSLSVSSTPGTATATGADSVSAGNHVTMVCSSNSSGADLTFTIKVTR